MGLYDCIERLFVSEELISAGSLVSYVADVSSSSIPHVFVCVIVLVCVYVYAHSVYASCQSVTVCVCFCVGEYVFCSRVCLWLC